MTFKDFFSARKEQLVLASFLLFVAIMFAIYDFGCAMSVCSSTSTLLKILEYFFLVPMMGLSAIFPGIAKDGAGILAIIISELIYIYIISVIIGNWFFKVKLIDTNDQTNKYYYLMNAGWLYLWYIIFGIIVATIILGNVRILGWLTRNIMPIVICLLIPIAYGYIKKYSIKQCMMISAIFIVMFSIVAYPITSIPISSMSTEATDVYLFARIAVLESPGNQIVTKACTINVLDGKSSDCFFLRFGNIISIIMVSILSFVILAGCLFGGSELARFVKKRYGKETIPAQQQLPPEHKSI